MYSLQQIPELPHMQYTHTPLKSSHACSETRRWHRKTVTRDTLRILRCWISFNVILQVYFTCRIPIVFDLQKANRKSDHAAVVLSHACTHGLFYSDNDTLTYDLSQENRKCPLLSFSSLSDAQSGFCLSSLKEIEKGRRGLLDVSWCVR